VTDLFAYCADQLPAWNTISISGYHIREAGSTAAQEIGFTIANALAYVEAARGAGLEVDAFAPRLSFFWNAHSNFLEEVAKYRAARRLWARLMRERVGATNPASWKMRFHTQTAGSSLTAQQPLTNVVRTALEALSAVLGGTQSLHTNSFDEALGLPTEEAATLALRTQQIIAHESGVADTVDPLAGSYVVEHLTDQLEAKALEIIDWVDRNGGAVAAVENGLVQAEIEESAYRTARAIDSGEQVIVGVNRFQEGDGDDVPPLVLDPDLERDQVARLATFKQGRGEIGDELEAIRSAAAGSDNLLYPMKQALAAGATVGEVSNVLREVFGEYRP
jgi:methylmalonyl-CoA mutase N-terminal domain/subunit